ncbi:uncharacterized protein LOC126968206 [Leptidea sinapis]|uniref:uncharacterized protein LOC126968206 n=1 Tax=Leptidea sinapis TaxID=189913 RepID=UPI00212DF03C|nr:uncharacterized protein LOC126968206 [Leptidea sinapis]
MSQQSEHLDFSGLFKLDVLVHLDIVNHTFYEVGLKKFIALSSDKELMFLYINPQWERFDNVFDWDFVDNPVYCMCFDPSGTWVLIVSDQKVLLVPFLPLFIPQNTFDHKWSLSSVTVLPLGDIVQPTSVVWWITKESENIIIIGSKTGTISFYSLESQKIIAETKVNGQINDLQMCFDDSLDLLALLISKGPIQQWKLVLEHRSFGYNWITQIRAQNDKDKKEGFMSYIRQLSKDKITLFIQGGSKDESRQAVEYVLKPTEYLPIFRKGSNNWALTAQYVLGRHYLTAFELNEGTIILESPGEDSASRTLRPKIKKDGQYIQGLWSQRLLYLVRKNELEVHSANFSVIQGEALLGTKRDFSELWTAEMIGDVQKAYLMCAKGPSTTDAGWREPTFMSDLQLPRFVVEPCLVITSCGAYILNTVCEPCEWLVGLIMRGGVGAELSAAALGAPVPILLRAAADMLMAKGKIAPAQYLYSLSQSQPDGWIARLGVFGRIHELSMFKQDVNSGNFGNAAVTAKLLALLLKIRTNSEEKFEVDVKFTNLGTAELLELTTVAAAIGLWELVPVFSIHRGYPHLFLTALKARKDICRGAIMCLLNQPCVLPILLEENGQWLFDFITEKCNQFDTIILKRLCLWLNPLQNQLRPVVRDLKQGITSIYATRMLQQISTFMHVVCATEARIPCPELQTEMKEQSEMWKYHFLPRRALSCGLSHWAVAEEGNAKIMIADTAVNTELIGSVVDVACGRHHTLLLTENGIYSAGDNTYGQLGVGSMWAGGVGDTASAGGALAHVRADWTSPVTAVAAGHYHSAAIDLGGRLYTWGWGVHGQLCLGTILDHSTPQLVTKFQGRKVLSVSCGACHTVVLTVSGQLWASGAGVFGQLGGAGRDKSSRAVRVALPDPVQAIAAGYFHNLALTTKGQLWCWGASPQQVRATHARRTTPTFTSDQVAPTASATSSDSHLVPQLVDIHNVKGKIVQVSAGWHHSCIIDSTGTVYTWGLNFDGQLGSGDRKQVQIPTEVQILEGPSDVKENTSDCDDGYGGVVACGGDFTVYIRRDGRIYATGNMHQQLNNEVEKSINRMIMMKTTKRVIKIPASRSNNKFIFQQVDRIHIMFPFDIDGLERKSIEPIKNPLAKMSDFKRNSWADELIILLKPWINEDMLLGNSNMAAKFAYHNNNFSDCLKYLLDNLKREYAIDRIYLTHPDDIENASILTKQDETKIIIRNAISKRIKDISMKILNEEPYAAIEPSVYKSLPCCCDELKYSTKLTSKLTHNTDKNLSLQAAHLIDKAMGLFPVDAKLWETCFKICKDFYLENDLCIEDLEVVMCKFMENNASTMASAIMYSKDCAQYAEILTPKFYLNMCNEILDTWG